MHIDVAMKNNNIRKTITYEKIEYPVILTILLITFKDIFICGHFFSYAQ